MKLRSEDVVSFDHRLTLQLRWVEGTLTENGRVGFVIAVLCGRIHVTNAEGAPGYG